MKIKDEVTLLNEANSNEGNTESLNKPERLEWLKDAGFGLFIHWSLDVQLGCVISHTLIGSSKQYRDKYFRELPKTFNPKEFDAEKIAILAKTAGVKYVVFTTKHHNGFCWWNTKTTDFNIMNTPYGKDLLAEYVAALRKYDLAVGFYYSPEDFLFLHERDLKMYRKPGETPIEYPEEIKNEYHKLIREQCTELMTNYGKIDVMFLDGKPQEPAKEVCWKLQPDILITRGAIKTPEQTLLGVGGEEPWETCMTMGTGWQYKPTNEKYKSGTRLIEILIETRAKGGTLLLNIGPDSYGRIPMDQENILREIGMWNFINEESVQDVRPWIITNENNIWYTRDKHSNTVYAYLTKLPNWKKGERKEFILHSVKATEKSEISVLGQSDEVVEYRPDIDAKSRFEQKEDGLHISVVRAQRIYNNDKWPNPIVVKLTNVEPALIPPRVITINDELETEPLVKLKGQLKDMGDSKIIEVGFEYREYAGFVEELYNDEWLSTDSITLNKNGLFELEMNNLEKGKTYQYRAYAKAKGVIVRGDICRFQF